MTIVEIVGGPLTVSVKLELAVNPAPSVTVSVMVLVPLCPTAGVNVTVRDAPVPPNTMFTTGSNVVLLEAPATVSVVAGVIASPTVKASAPVATMPRLIVLFVIVVMVGGPFTVKIKLVVAVNPPPSITVSVMVDVPPFPDTGVTVTARADPEPPKTIFAFGSSVVLLDAPVTDNNVTAVRSSPTVNGSAAVDAPELTVCADMVVIVGAPFTVSEKVVLAVSPPPSVTVSVMMADPLCPLAGVTVTVREPADPPKTIFAVGTNVVLLDVPTTDNDDNAVKSSVKEKANAEVAIPVLTSWLAIAEMVGGAFTVSLKLVDPVSPPPSRTDNVMVVIPLFPLTGVTITVRAVPTPPKTILATGTSVVLLEAPVTVSDAAAVRSSPTVKDKEEVAVLIVMS